MPSKMQKPYIGNECLKCGHGKLIETADGGEWWLECNECENLLFCYNPMPHQEDFHSDGHKFKMFAGGFGSAKTSTCAAEMIKLVLDTPNGTSLIGAATLPQLEQTSKKDFLSMIHKKLIAKESVQKNYIDLVNGHRVLFRPLDDEGKARSLNLCFVWIEEASEVNFDYITQLQTRLRNHATDHHTMLLSTNPDLGHVRSEFLLKADKVYGAEDQPLYIADEDKNENISVHLASTRKNTHLPQDYYASTAAGKPKWWVARYLEASFSYAEGAVYQDASDHFVTPFEIEENIRKDGWLVYGGGDFGIRDYTVLLLAAVDPKDGVVYIYDEYYQNERTVPQHAHEMNQMLEIIPRGGLMKLSGDPSGKRRNINDHQSLFDHYREYGIYFHEGNNRIEPGIAKVQSYFALGKLKIFTSCVNTIKEIISYKYKPLELDSSKNVDEKPIDKDNHAMDSLRYLVNSLPDDPDQLRNKSHIPSSVNRRNPSSWLPHALRAPENRGNSATGWYNKYY
jgi:phage terminase large subunit